MSTVATTQTDGTVSKGQWYKKLISQADKAYLEKYYLETLFISYLIIDDRLNSICKHSCINYVDKKGKTLMFGLKMGVINDYIAVDPNTYLAAQWKKHNFAATLIDWSNKRNHYMHAAGNDNLTWDEYETRMKPLAKEGIQLERKICTFVMKMKKKP